MLVNANPLGISMHSGKRRVAKLYCPKLCCPKLSESHLHCNLLRITLRGRPSRENVQRMLRTRIRSSDVERKHKCRETTHKGEIALAEYSLRKKKAARANAHAVVELRKEFVNSPVLALCV
jgi:hypothetical protein